MSRKLCQARRNIGKREAILSEVTAQVVRLGESGELCGALMPPVCWKPIRLVFMNFQGDAFGRSPVDSHS